MKCVCVFILLTCQLASAESPTPALQPASDKQVNSVGLRIGGYGFRRSEGDSRNAWDDCRMNGMGVFYERRFGSWFFLESGADIYFSESFPFNPAEGEEMSRLSGLFTVAAGARAYPNARLSPYVQIGFGAEATKVKMSDLQENRLLPEAFVGFGADIRLDRVHLGANLRAHVMAHFPHGTHAHAHTTTTAAGPEPMGLNAEAEAVAQIQFYMRYDL